MARSLNPLALTEIGKKLGTEPIFILEVNWADSLPIGKYADKDYFDIPGRIIELSELDAVLKIGSGGVVQSVSVTLDDTDGSIKAIIDAHDPHKRPISVLQTFDSLVESDKFLLFSGTIVTPIVWDERQRTISFSIESNIEDKEVGFSPEQGQFEFISDRAVGKAWPLCFGSPLRVPAVKLTERVRGTSLTRYGLITQNDLDTLCDRAGALASQEVIKEGQDANPGVTETNYNTTLSNIASTQASLNVFLEGLIVDSPTQESNLRSYVQVCKDIQTKTDERDNALSSLNTIQSSLEEVRADIAQKEIQLANAITVYTNTPNAENLAVVTGLQQELERLRNGVPSTIQQSIQRILDYEDLIEAEEAKATDNDATTIPDQTLINNWEAIIITEKAFINSFDEYEDIINGAGEVVVPDANELAGLSFLEASEVNQLNIISAANTELTTLNTTKATLEDDLKRVVLTEIIVKDGEKFPQGVDTNIIINGAKFRGTFSGEVFTVSEPELPLFTNVTLGERQNDNANEFWIQDSSINLKNQYVWLQDAIIHVSEQDGTRCFFNPVIFKGAGAVTFGILTRNNYDLRLISGDELSTDKILETSAILLPKWLNYINALGRPTAVSGLANITNQDYSIEIGDEVFIEDNYEDVYIANLIPSTVVKEVLAFRTVEGVRQLLPVPNRLYTVNLDEEIAGQNATTIRFNRPLTEFIGENWEEQIYVSLTSSQGPNTADIIKYIIDTYLDIDSDDSSFSSVAAFLATYPSHFALLELKNGIQLIEDIAFQARCAVIVKNDIAEIKYLAAEETEVATLNTTNVVFGQFSVEMTETESLVTKLTAIWQEDYVQIDDDEEPNKLILRNNIPKYGLLEKEFDFFIYNIKELVLKSATFWIIRLSNTWKTVDCQVFLTELEVEALDQVLLDFPADHVASSSVKGVVLESDYDSDNNVINLKVQSPVQAGQVVAHPLFYSATAPASTEYPTAFDPFAGGAA